MDDLSGREQVGSSPLARGLLCFGVALGHFSRIIPARAGFTGVTAWKTYQAVDHPRSRGVYVEGFRGFALSSGSSPLARGLRRAYRARVSLWDHPRSRGVYRRRLRRRPRPEGSSPLARGLHVPADAQTSAPRIIPARAGFTPPREPGPCTGTDHPRSRGVYMYPNFSGAPDRGSSPLARGLPGIRHRPGFERGIIPARAGFTTSPSPPTSSGGDHPRSRGVYNYACQRR